MQHHRHPGLAGRLAPDAGHELVPHPDATRSDARHVWVPLPDASGREVDALEGLLCVPTRPGAMRVVAVPHVASHLALGDELAVADWDGEPMARGELASSLDGTVRIVTAAGGTWRAAAELVHAAVATADTAVDGPWFDVIGEGAVAASVPRVALPAVFAALAAAAGRDELRWEYATPERHADAVGAARA